MNPVHIILTTLLVIIIFVSYPVHADSASEEDMALYTRISAINACVAASAGIEFDKTVGVAGETMAQVLLGQHKGLVQQVGSDPLSIEDLRKGSINAAVIGAYELCPEKVPDEILSKVKAALNRRGSK